MKKDQLLAKAQEIRRRLREIEATEKSKLRKQRNRAAYIVGGWILRNQPEDARRLLNKLSDRDQEIVRALLPAPEESPKHSRFQDRELPEL